VYIDDQSVFNLILVVGTLRKVASMAIALRGWGARLVCAAGLVCAALPAFGQADVTLSDPGDITAYGLVGNIRGYALGSRTCNKGNVGLIWANNGTPSLAMNIYRLHDGRMQQIGWSFLKRACCAASGSTPLCGTCQGSVSGGLGIGCLDVYSAGWNGGQSRLGPRSQVNPSTGAHAAHNPPAVTLTAIARRIQVLDSDLDTTATGAFQGARFFSEGVYAASDEGPAQRLNNATYRPMTMTNTTSRTFGMAGVAVEGAPALVAWRDHGLGLNQPDPSVTVNFVDVPGEGRYWYGYKVSARANNTWRYEYAIFNLTSARAGGSFFVPVPCGVTVSNIGFSSPWYHSGEIYNSTPWVSTRSSEGVSWSCADKFEQNPNGNALRWGSTFNFWFDANVPLGGCCHEAGFVRDESGGWSRVGR
jgi:hypothetical protein